MKLDERADHTSAECALLAWWDEEGHGIFLFPFFFLLNRFPENVEYLVGILERV